MGQNGNGNQPSAVLDTACSHDLSCVWKATKIGLITHVALWAEVSTALSAGPDLPPRGTILEFGAPATPDLVAGE